MPFPPSTFRPWPLRPRLARSLRHLARAVDRRWPDRQDASDGWIGDVQHTYRLSDHNPDARGVVRALDVTTTGLDWDALLPALLRHPSVDYFIHHGMLWSHRTGFRPVPYRGPNPHVSHVHVSILDGRPAARSRRRWF